MKVKELTDRLLSISTPWFENSETDSIKFGNPGKEIRKLAVCCIATPDILKAAADWGADLLITHEPTFYNDGENIGNDAVSKKKYDIIKNSDMAIFRYHDRLHTNTPDIIGEGFLRHLGISANYIERAENGINSFICENAVTASELADMAESRLGLKNIRICGEKNKKSTGIALCLGATNPMKSLEILKRDTTEIMICGETWEWLLCEYARDASQMGINKSVLLLGHMGSERDGMKFIAGKLSEKYTDFETKYFECGEVYN